VSRHKRVAITSGDTDGVGLEVSVKALKALGPQKQTQFYLYRSPRSPDFHLPQFKRIQVLSLEDALSLEPQSKQLIEIVIEDSPAKWVEEVAKACINQELDSMVTAPLSKQEIQNAGFTDIGHTDILKRVSGKKTAFMTFMGPKFNVLLVSGHIPVAQVEKTLTNNLLSEAVKAAHQARAFLSGSAKNRPLAVLGLNPHAGDKGIIGSFDEKLLVPTLRKLSRSYDILGPLVPDVAFLPENWKKYSLYLALYHDQGLIPFKMIHGFDAGVHLTLGLPIRRSSVDHGTAKDLFGRNKANPGSMIEALKWGVRLAHKG
jgi:4-hydroxythreonine-4-phosphate dehydrogenase